MPTLAAARPMTAGSNGRPANGSSSAGAGSATSRTKASKPAGDLEEMERRALEIPHRTRYLRLIDDYARRSLDAQREWLDAVQEELERQQ